MQRKERKQQFLDMQEHPENYTERQIEAMMDNLDRTPDVEKAWHDFESTHFPKAKAIFRTSFQKIAASFIGLLMLSGIALAAVHIVSSRHDNGNGTLQTADSTAKASGRSEIEPTTGTTPRMVVFENTELQRIVDSLTNYYQVKPAYRSESVRHLRLYFEWDQRNSIGDIAGQISQFDHVSISLRGDSIIIE
ncbi:MAG: DUF4974 domain-containing protein [Prevotella sp.]|nr:DUF4974 domain-containing protein [Prevotella sp.]